MKLRPLTHPLSLALACVGLAVVADLLFWKAQGLGWTPAGMLAALTAAAALRPSCRGNSATKAVFLAGVVLSILAAVWQPSFVAFALGYMFYIAWTFARRGTWSGHASRVLGWAAAMVPLAWFRVFRDLPPLMRRRPGVATCAGRVSRELLLWIVPVAISFFFLLLFCAANPIVSRLLQDATRWMLDWIVMPPVERILFWAFVAAMAWGLLRLRGRRRWREAPWRDEPALRAPRSVVVRILLACNVVFLVPNLVDLVYLWGGHELPDGMGYAQFAHRGAYPLIFTALLAAGFVLFVFRDRSNARADTMTTRLVVLWIAQNVLLTVSSIARLGIYVDAYGLTLLRLSAMLWMGLVAFGLAMISVRIATHRTNTWLVNTNIAATALLLLACSFFNMRGFVARYNVDHQATARTGFDMGYARRLGPEALPALYVLRDRAGAEPPVEQLDSTIRILEGRLASSLRDPRGWSVRRAALAHVVAGRAGSS